MQNEFKVVDQFQSVSKLIQREWTPDIPDQEYVFDNNKCAFVGYRGTFHLVHDFEILANAGLDVLMKQCKSDNRFWFILFTSTLN